MAAVIIPFGEGSLRIDVSGDSIVGSSFHREKIPRRRTLETESRSEMKILERVVKEIDAFLAQRLQVFTVPIKLSGTAFQKRVWRELCRIPYGETCSYGDVAYAIGSPRSARAVGGAVGANRFLLYVPCHRVIQGDGGLGGFGCGLDMKRFLLRLEGHTISD